MDVKVSVLEAVGYQQVHLIGIGQEVDPAASLAVAGWRKVVARDGPARDLIVICGALREPLPPADPASDAP